MNFLVKSIALIVISFASFSNGDMPIEKPRKLPKQPKVSIPKLPKTPKGKPIITNPPSKPKEEEKKPPIEEEPSDPPPVEEPEPPTLYGEEIPSRGETLIYVIDISGSMSLRTDPFTDMEGNTVIGTRLDRAKIELKRSILALEDSYSFNIIAYHCGTIIFSSKSVKATPQNKQRAINWIDSRLRAHGGTGIGPAVSKALEEEPDTVVLLSDGSPNCGARSPNQHVAMIRQHNKGSIIHTFGISVWGRARRVMQRIARENGGNYYEIN